MSDAFIVEVFEKIFFYASSHKCTSIMYIDSGKEMRQNTQRQLFFHIVAASGRTPTSLRHTEYHAHTLPTELQSIVLDIERGRYHADYLSYPRNLTTPI